MGKERAGAGEVLFGFLRVKLVFDFVVFEWNGEKAKAVDAAGGGACSGIVHAELKPKRVAKIDEQKQGERREEDAARDMAEGRRGIGESGWFRGHGLSVVEISGCRTLQLYQHGDGDAFIAVVEVAVAAQIRATFDGVARIVLEDAPLFAENDAGDQAFLLAAQQ